MRWNHNTHYHGFVLSAIPPNCRRALDVGCGLGALARKLPQHCEEVVAIDTDSECITHAATVIDVPQNITFLSGDVLTHSSKSTVFLSLHDCLEKAWDAYTYPLMDGNLVFMPTPDRPLTKAQQTFRTLLAKVASLRESIDADEEELDATLSFYAKDIVPRLTRQTTLQKELVRALAPYLNKTFFPRREERVLFKELARELLDEIANAEKGLIDADLREIYNAVHGVGYAQDERKAIAAAKAALAERFADAGLEADFSELDSAVSEADFMTRAEALIARVRKMKEAEAEATLCTEHGRHATEDEHLREAEEFRKRSIANIYKQLARVLHPDLERDPERLMKKVQLMQELTEAYRQNDLHTLLRLEMQWIENEGGDNQRLTEEKLGV